jgi:hypothetical protein
MISIPYNAGVTQEVKVQRKLNSSKRSIVTKTIDRCSCSDRFDCIITTVVSLQM